MSRTRSSGATVLPLRPGAGPVADIEVRPPVKIDMFTRYSLATYLGVHVNTVDRLVKRGEIPVYRVAGRRRFYPEDVEQYVRGHRES
jgi:excisionase family DNA binding protein